MGGGFVLVRASSKPSGAWYVSTGFWLIITHLGGQRCDPGSGLPMPHVHRLQAIVPLLEDCAMSRWHEPPPPLLIVMILYLMLFAYIVWSTGTR